jgi:hypothetical protein
VKFVYLYILLTVFNIQSAFCQINRRQSYNAIESRFDVPDGFHRIKVHPESYANWLRNLPLLPQGSPVLDYRGKEKLSANDTTLAAIIDYNIHGKKLEQCMDIIIRFRAEYLFSKHQYSDIQFYLPGNYTLTWTDWMNGFRPHYKGIQVTLIKTHPVDSSRTSFDQYLTEIFYHSYTQTAYYAYRPIKPDDIQIGDFFVKKGKKGHAVLVVDLAEDDHGNRIALIGHGDTPARQFHILNYKKDQPWVSLNTDQQYIPLPIKKKMLWDGLRRF